MQKEVKRPLRSFKVTSHESRVTSHEFNRQIFYDDEIFGERNNCSLRIFPFWSTERREPICRRCLGDKNSD